MKNKAVNMVIAQSGGPSMVINGSLAGACVCLMTGTLTDEVRKRADELGASGCLGKPLNAAELAEMIKYAKIQNGGNRI